MAETFKTTPRAKAEAWEADESIVTVEGLGFIGGTMRHADAQTVARWLNERGGMHDLIASLEPKFRAAIQPAAQAGEEITDGN